MLCPRCGYYSDKEETVCPECGEILHSDTGLPTEGAEAIRQGKRARAAILDPAGKQMMETRRRRRSGASRATIEMPAVQDEPDEPFSGYTVSENEADDSEPEEAPSFERRRRQVYDENSALEEQAKAYTEWIGKGGSQRTRLINWMKVYLVAIVLAVLALGGTWLFLKETDAGQRLMARMGKEANSSALWAVGEDLMNNGDIEGAIANFEKAKEQDEKDEKVVVDVDGLLMLGNAYEASGRTDKAIKLYKEIYTQTPSRAEAYVNHIRILMNSGKESDLAEAGELMKEAYKNTNVASFQTQRNDLLPAPPKVKSSVVGTFFEVKKNIPLESSQGYDIYYTFDVNTPLPSGGQRYTQPIALDEGIWNLRAVAVNGLLVSDELKCTFRIVLPSPEAPLTNLAPGAYKTRQKVKLRRGKENEKDDTIKIYYTVDGSIPNKYESPLYKDEPIQLPSGRAVTIRAVAINLHNKYSNVREVTYKIDAKPYPLTAWDIEETIGGLELNKTTLQEFQQVYGEGARVKMDPIPEFESECRKYEYSWGYAVMNLVKRNWVLVELYFKDKTFKAPRETGIGDPLNYVVGKFRDMGQLESEENDDRKETEFRKTRGLYHLNSGDDGKILYPRDTEEKLIRYRIKNEGEYTLEYQINKNDTVTAIDWRYRP